MSTNIYGLLLLLLFCTAEFAFAQEISDDDMGRKVSHAVKLMDNGQYDESEAVLNAVLDAKPDYYGALYEMAYLHYMKGDYNAAVKQIQKAIQHPSVEDLAYQLLGNAYDYLGNLTKAIATYKEGLKKFPDAGCLYLEQGNMAFGNEEYLEALSYYEQGIAVEPSFLSNYRSAAIVLFNSSEPIWAMLYGEIFMNLERNTARTRMMSGALYDAYRKAIVIGEEEQQRVVNYHFTQNNTAVFGDGVLTTSFPWMYTLMVESIFPKEAGSVDVETLDTMRRAFIVSFFDKLAEDNCEHYSNVLFDYQRQMAIEGHFEAYNYWLLGQGNEKILDKWCETHVEAWTAFVDWANANPMKIDKQHYFHRQQYDNINFKF